MRYLTIILFLSPILALAQHHNQAVDQDTIEAHSLSEWLQKGSFGGLMRYQLMTSDYNNANYYANAIGGRLHYETANLIGFQIGVAGNFVYNIGSSKFEHQTPATFEKQLFDVTDPSNRKDLDRLEELYLKYHISGLQVVFGKQTINTPLVNAQDSRMKPTVFRGISTSWNKNEFDVAVGFYDKVSARSTLEWVTISESLELYENALLGEHGQHAGELSEGLIIASVKKEFDNLELSLWNYSILNVSNTSLLQGEIKLNHWFFGEQIIYQTKDNKELDFTSSQSWVSSNLIQYEIPHFTFSSAGSFVLHEGRFDFPREFGVAELYTRIPRNRIEGLDNFKTFSLGTTYYPFNDHHLGCSVKFLRTSYELPDSGENDSIKQLNFQLDYQFDGLLEGLNLRALAIMSETDINKKDHYSHFNLFANINF